MQDIKAELSKSDIARGAELYGNVSRAIDHANWKIGTNVDAVSRATYKAIGEIYITCLTAPTGDGFRRLQTAHAFLIDTLSQLMQTHAR